MRSGPPLRLPERSMRKGAPWLYWRTLSSRSRSLSAVPVIETEFLSVSTYENLGSEAFKVGLAALCLPWLWPPIGGLGLVERFLKYCDWYSGDLFLNGSSFWGGGLYGRVFSICLFSRADFWLIAFWNGDSVFAADSYFVFKSACPISSGLLLKCNRADLSSWPSYCPTLSLYDALP